MRKLFILAASWSFFLLGASEDVSFDDLKFQKVNLHSSKPTQHSDLKGAPQYQRYDQTHQLMMGPQAVIDGCVNAITGNFFDSEIDLEIAGSGLNLTRFYSSGSGTTKAAFEGDYENYCTDFFRGWSWNHATQLYWLPYWSYLHLANMHNGCSEQFIVEKQTLQAKIHSNVFKGWTNTARGLLGAQSDLHNQRAEFQPRRNHSQQDRWVVTVEDGTKRIFSSYPTSYGKDKSQRWFCHETNRNLPSGLNLAYKHHKSFDLDCIEWKSRSSNHSIASIKKIDSTLFETSDGQTARYYLKDYEEGYNKVPVKVERTHKPTVEYEYQQFIFAKYSKHKKWETTSYRIYNDKHVPFLNKKRLPEGRFLEIQYLDGFPKLHIHKGKLKGNKYPLPHAGKVSALLAPLGGDQQAHVKYSFTYQDRCTIVKDACNGIQEFQFDDENRLISVTSHGDHGQYLKRHYVWSDSTGEKFWYQDAKKGFEQLKVMSRERDLKPGYLMRQWATDESGKVLYRKSFEYDKYGNVVEEHLIGNLTGHNLEAKLDHKGLPITKTEACCTRYEYSQDDFHLLKREIHRNGHEIQYIYAPQSNLLIASFEKVKGSIIRRQFQTYDDFGNVCFSIEDDGTSEQPDDLTGVHVRRLKSKKAYETGSQIGLIEEETDSYWDLEKQQSTLLSKTTYTYYPNRLLKSQKTFIAESSQVIEKYFEYDAHRNITLERLPNGSTIIRRYDANDNCIFSCGPDPRVEVHMLYDTMNRLIEKKEKHADEELTTRYQYDSMSKLICETSPYGTSRKISYDPFGRPIRVELPIQFDTEGNRASSSAFETYIYDAFGRMIEKRDALGYVEKYDYNCLDQLTFEQKQGQVSTRHYYNVEGLKVETVMGTGARETYHYDELGRQIKQNRYDENGNELFSQTLTYEGALPSCIQDSTGREELLFYDGAGRVIEKQIKENGNETWLKREQWRYDGLNRVISHRQYANETDYIDLLSAYDEMGQLTEVRQLTSNGTMIGHELYEFDSSGRVTREVKLTGNKLEEKYTEYDSYGKPITHTDALGNIWRYEYRRLQDYQQLKLDHVIEYKPDGTRKEEWQTEAQLPIESKIYGTDDLLAYEARYGYDIYQGVTYRLERTLLEGHETSVPVITRVHYGPARKVIDRIDAAGSACERKMRWDYDKHGLLKTAYLPSGKTLQYNHDTTGLLSRVLSSDGTIDQQLEHDSYGHLIKITDANGTVVERSYNALGQMIYENMRSSLGNYSVEKSYDGLGRLLEIKLPNEVEIIRDYEHTFLRKVAMRGALGSYEHRFLEYDESGRIVKESLVGGTGELERSYDALGRVNHLKTPYFQSKIHAFDALGRVKHLERGFSSLHELHYQYDALGQLLEETYDNERISYCHNSRQQRIAKNQDFYLHNDLSELLQVEKEDGENNTDQMEYDLDGRLIFWKRGEKSYELSYDAMNRLIHVHASDGYAFEYLYDGLDRRIGKRQIDPTGQIQNQIFIYDDQFELGSLQDGSWKDFRLIGLRTQAETGDTLLAIIDGKAYGTILDLQGSIVGWVDLDTHSLVATCEYDAFGIPSSTPLGPWGYVAKRLDPETGFLFYGKRYYLSTYGRWLTKDPKGEMDGSNLYAFIKNNPVYNWDLWGLSVEKIGTKRPIVFGDYTNPEVLKFSKTINESFEETSLYECKGHYNARVIACINDPRKPWMYVINGIYNSEWECAYRTQDCSKKEGINVLAVYHSSMGLLNDAYAIGQRNILGYDPERAEYALIGKTFDLGLKFNRALGINEFDGITHSKGEHAGIRGLYYMQNPKDIANIGMLGVGGVGDHALAPKSFINHKCYIDHHDYIAKIGRIGIDSSRVEYGKFSKGFNRHNFDDGYWDTCRQYIQSMYKPDKK